MNKVHYTLIIFLIGIFLGRAQTKKIFEENFSNNSKQWLEANDEKYDFFFRNGKYCIINNVNFFYGEQKKINIDENEDFIIETSIALNWKDTGIAYFIFGANVQTQNYFYFAFDKNNAYIGKFIDGQHINKSKRIKLKDFGVPNLLKIQKRNNDISFYFNNKKVLKKEYEDFFGSSFGFGVSNKQNISIDYLTAFQDINNKIPKDEYSTNKEKVTYTFKDKNKIILKKKGGVYHIPVKLNGVLDIDFIFDSGASDVSITPEIALTLIKTGTIQRSDWLKGAYYKFADGSIAESKRFKLKSVKVGNKIVYNVTCSISNHLSAPMLLGQSVMEKFGKYTFDYKTNELIID